MALATRLRHIYASDSAYTGGLLLVLGLLGTSAGLWAPFTGVTTRASNRV
jgi:hypothetical protein